MGAWGEGTHAWIFTRFWISDRIVIIGSGNHVHHEDTKVRYGSSWVTVINVAMRSVYQTPSMVLW